MRDDELTALGQLREINAALRRAQDELRQRVRERERSVPRPQRYYDRVVKRWASDSVGLALHLLRGLRARLSR